MDGICNSSKISFYLFIYFAPLRFGAGIRYFAHRGTLVRIPEAYSEFYQGGVRHFLTFTQLINKKKKLYTTGINNNKHMHIKPTFRLQDWRMFIQTSIYVVNKMT